MKIKIILEICELWNYLDNKMFDIHNFKNEMFLGRYFVLKKDYTFNDNVFNNVNNLIEALIELKNFYISKENHYESNYSLLILKLSYYVILKYEEYPEWFEEKKKEVAKLMMEVGELACNLDKIIDDYTKDNITKIKIYTYKFNEYCENEVNSSKK